MYVCMYVCMYADTGIGQSYVCSDAVHVSTFNFLYYFSFFLYVFYLCMYVCMYVVGLSKKTNFGQLFLFVCMH